MVGELKLSRGLKQVGEAVKSHIRGWRLPPATSREDVEQEVHANLAEDLGPDYGARIEKAMAEGPDFKKTIIFGVIMRCLDRARYSLIRRRAARGAVSLSDLTDPEGNSGGIEAVDLAIDLAEVLDRFNPKEQEVWRLMCQGYRTSEIAGKLGMPHQRASELKAKVIAKISDEMARVMRIIKE